MQAVIVYESMFGSTKKVAEAIAGGLADGAEVSVVPVTSAGAHILDGADLVVVGGPTHTHGMSRPGTRKMAGKRAGKPGSEVELVPGAVSGRKCANGSHRSAGWRSPALLSIPGCRDCQRSPAGHRSLSAGISPATGPVSRQTRELPRRGLTGALAGANGAGPRLGTALTRSDRLRSVVGRRRAS